MTDNGKKKIRILLLWEAIVLVCGLIAYVLIFRTGSEKNPETPVTEAVGQTVEAAPSAEPAPLPTPEPTAEPVSYEAPEILPEYAALYEQNQDMIGWLTIEDTVIDYPVMQTMWDENYYLRLGFDREKNQNGCLIMDTDSVVGSGTSQYAYQDGTAPSSNLIIHGHTMKSGEMFGRLSLYEKADYGAQHSVIKFSSLYEHREYELIAVFYSEVFYVDEEVFKYYKFFQANTQEEFDDWYDNIKSMSLYDTGVTAQLGDEFITLSCCSYHVEDGRFVVVGKRIK